MRRGVRVNPDNDAVPDPVRGWQEAVHLPGVYDFEVDTSRFSPEECADQIRKHLEDGGPRPSAFERLAAQVTGTA